MPPVTAESLFEAEDLYANLTENYDYEQLNDEREFSYMALIYLAIMPISCVVGLTGNCLVFILIRSNQIFRRLPSSPALRSPGFHPRQLHIPV